MTARIGGADAATQLWNSFAPPITLIGHPYAPTGRGEHIRAIWRALRTVGVHASIYDLTGSQITDPAFGRLKPHILEHVPDGVRLFHINGYEVGKTLLTLELRQPGVRKHGFNIVFPAWELPNYPYGAKLEWFDEVWTASAFVEQSIRAAVSIPVIRIPNACEPHLLTKHGRDHFGLPKHSFLILFLFDMCSLHSRKNPLAAIEAFKGVLSLRPSAEVHLAIKVSHPEHDLHFIKKFRAAVRALGERVTLMEGTWSLDEARSLIQCSDCFLSLHRSEGFGRGPAEAMFFGKPVVATGWSGNMEYMNDKVAFPVAYNLVPVRPGEFRYWQNQVWADPDISEAVAALVRILDDRALANRVGRRARAHMRRNFSDVALGSRYRARLAEIAREAATTVAGDTLKV
jgi:glycosyltransferase involved in cell wall biosynthesis